MQRARHDFISGKQDVSDSTEVLWLSAVECIVLLTLWFIILSCLGRCNKRPSHIILLNRSIVHAIRPHVSEVPCSGTVSAHTTFVPRPSPTEPSLSHLLQPSQGLLNKPRRTRHRAITLVKRTGLWGSDTLGHGSKHPEWVHL